MAARLSFNAMAEPKSNVAVPAQHGAAAAAKGNSMQKEEIELRASAASLAAVPRTAPSAAPPAAPSVAPNAALKEVSAALGGRAMRPGSRSSKLSIDESFPQANLHFHVASPLASTQISSPHDRGVHAHHSGAAETCASSSSKLHGVVLNEVRNPLLAHVILRASSGLHISSAHARMLCTPHLLPLALLPSFSRAAPWGTSFTSTFAGTRPDMRAQQQAKLELAGRSEAVFVADHDSAGGERIVGGGSPSGRARQFTRVRVCLTLPPS